MFSKCTLFAIGIFTCVQLRRLNSYEFISEGENRTIYPLIDDALQFMFYNVSCIQVGIVYFKLETHFIHSLLFNPFCIFLSLRALMLYTLTLIALFDFGSFIIGV